VIGSVPYKQETVAKLLENPINFLAMNPRSLADVYADIRLLGGITGLAKQAERVVKGIELTFSKIQKASKQSKIKPRVYSEAWPNPRISSPPWVMEIVNICGGQFALPAGQKVSDTQVAEANPDVIVLAWAAVGAKSDPRRAFGVSEWRDVPAIRDKRVYVIRDELLNTPGPPLVRGAQQLFRILHSKKAKGIN
jgi:iron complex transport system substrate-binding protein